MRFSSLLLLVTFLLATCAITPASGWGWPRLENMGISLMGFDVSDTCGYSRDDALQCIAVYVDTNHDKEISEAEFNYAKDAYLPRQAKMAHWIAKKLGYDVSIKDVLWGCDPNHDGRLTLSDWKLGAKTCLPGAADLCKLKTVCDIAEKLNSMSH
jgi:hypothetical protein